MSDVILKPMFGRRKKGRSGFVLTCLLCDREDLQPGGLCTDHTRAVRVAELANQGRRTLLVAFGVLIEERIATEVRTWEPAQRKKYMQRRNYLTNRARKRAMARRTHAKHSTLAVLEMRLRGAERREFYRDTVRTRKRLKNVEAGKPEIIKHSPERTRPCVCGGTITYRTSPPPKCDACIARDAVALRAQVNVLRAAAGLGPWELRAQNNSRTHRRT